MSELYHTSGENASGNCIERPGYYAVIPADVRYDDEISSTAKLMYGEIAALTNKEGYCYASNAYFCNLYQMSDRSITRIISSLEKRGYIITETRRDERNKVTGRKIRLNVSPSGVQPPDNFVGTSRQNCLPPPDKNVGENNRDNNKAEINTPDGFDRFWRAYPRKTDKKKARAAFAKVKVPVETLLAALEVQKKSAQWVKDGGAYIPHPTTWLNGERWEDEAAVAAPPAPAPEPDYDGGGVYKCL